MNVQNKHTGQLLFQLNKQFIRQKITVIIFASFRNMLKMGKLLAYFLLNQRSCGNI